MRRPSPPRLHGMGLIELMIAIVLGMLVVAAAGSIFEANKNTYKATESLGRVQENSRLAFELMARDIREVRGSACDSTKVPASMLNSTSWWSDLSNGIKGYDNGALAGSAAGSDAIQVVSATGNSYAINAMTSSSDAVTLTTSTHDIVTGDILQVCDFSAATIFQTTSAATGSASISHAASGSPGNSVNTLTHTSTDGSTVFGINSVVAKVAASQWYVASNAVGGKSLYRAQVAQGVLGAGQEIVEGVTDMQLTYLVSGGTAYQTSTAIDAASAWTNVVAVRIALTLQGTDKVGTNGAVFSRTVSHVVFLRNQKL